MKKQLFFLLLLISFVKGNSQTNNTYTLTSGGVTRSYILYVPAIYNASHPVPLLFNFHGYGSSNVQQEYYGDFRGIADTANFIMALPQGLSSGGSAGFNDFGTVASAAIDLNFTQAMIDSISAHFNINSCKIYSTGMSNGGFMSHDIACFLSSKFAAIASVSGSLMPSHASACNPSHPMPVMQIHGTSDVTVSYTGVGGIIGSIDIDSLVKLWVRLNNCNPVPTSSMVPNISTADSCTAQHFVYSGGNGNSTVEFFKIIGGGHSWPGSAYNISGVNTNQDFSASKEIWRFLRQYCLSNLTSVAEIEKRNIDFLLFPNPSNSILNFSFNKPSNNLVTIEITDILGKVVMTETTSDTSISVDKLNTGLYFFTLTQNAKQLVRTKFIKE